MLVFILPFTLNLVNILNWAKPHRINSDGVNIVAGSVISIIFVAMSKIKT